VPNQNNLLGDFATAQSLRQILARLERAAVANPDVEPTAFTRSGGTPPKVSGLTVSTAPGVINAEWNAATIPDLRYYEVQYATDAGFEQGVTTVRVGAPRLTFAGTDGTTYYIRARVVNQAGNPGGWSNTEDSLPGTVSTRGLAQSAATALYRFEQSSGFTALTSVGAGLAATYVDSADFGPLTVTVVDASSIVLPRVTFAISLSTAFDLSATDTNPALEFTVSLLRNGVVIDDATYDIQSSIDTNEVSIPSFATYDQPGAGTWQYSYRVAIERFSTDGSTNITLTPLNVLMEFIQNKR
jgi:hypothetical protein